MECILFCLDICLSVLFYNPSHLSASLWIKLAAVLRFVDAISDFGPPQTAGRRTTQIASRLQIGAGSRALRAPQASGAPASLPVNITQTSKFKRAKHQPSPGRSRRRLKWSICNCNDAEWLVASPRQPRRQDERPYLRASRCKIPPSPEACIFAWHSFSSPAVFLVVRREILLSFVAQGRILDPQLPVYLDRNHEPKRTRRNPQGRRRPPIRDDPTDSDIRPGPGRPKHRRRRHARRRRETPTTTKMEHQEPRSAPSRRRHQCRLGRHPHHPHHLHH